MAQGLLGKLTPATFLRRHWQKRPLFVPDAIADCGNWITRDTLFEWATRDDVESRLITRNGKRWAMRQGPFRIAELRRLPASGWTLLVQGVEQLDARAHALLQRFSFIPHARLDDLMVSCAPPGGGVGPHFDSYDVFLLQGTGTRRWRISAQKDMQLVADAPMRILRDFRHTQEWVAERGDLLYLPPRYAHDGVACDACITLSVGFRAPRRQELAAHFLEYLQDELHFAGIYEDRDLTLQRHPAALSSSMLHKFSTTLSRIRWNDKDILAFSGRYLTEPKGNVVFQSPRRPPALVLFANRLALRGVRLAPTTRMLFYGSSFFINGEQHRVDTQDRAALIRLADRREMPATDVSAANARLLHTWYCAGYIEF